MAGPFTLAIIDSGIGGLTLAIGLRAQNVKVMIYEGASKFDAVGAGIGVGPNALRAMEMMDMKFARLYDEVKAGNTSTKRRHEQIEILSAEEGFGITEEWKGDIVGHERFERSSGHRKDLLEIMNGLVQIGTVKFEKRVLRVENVDGGKKVEIEFAKGEYVRVDAVIGYDRIKGMTRKAVLGKRFPGEVPAKNLHTYVHRGITSMANAQAIVGHFAEDARWWMKDGSGWAMCPITQGREVNIVAFVQDKNEWEGERSAREITREEMLQDFAGYDKRLFELLEYVKPAKWPLFHHPDTPTYYEGRICLLGDVAHASSPGQAVGAGQGLEDALILSKPLGRVQNPDQLDAAIQVYDAVRRPRAQKVVQDSGVITQQYSLQHPDFGDDLKKITEDANRGLAEIWWYDLEGDVRKAEESLMALARNEGSSMAEDGQEAEVGRWQCVVC